MRWRDAGETANGAAEAWVCACPGCSNPVPTARTGRNASQVLGPGWDLAVSGRVPIVRQIDSGVRSGGDCQPGVASNQRAL